MDVLRRLLDLPLFAGVSKQDLEELVALVDLQTLAEGELLMDIGDEGNDIAIVMSGGFTVELGQGSAVLPLAWVSAGEILGETALFRRASKRTARVKAAEDSSVLRLDSGVLDQLARRGNGVPRAIEEGVMRVLARRIHDSVEAIDGVLAAHLDTVPDNGRKSTMGRLRELLRR